MNDKKCALINGDAHFYWRKLKAQSIIHVKEAKDSEKQQVQITGCAHNN